MDVTAEELPAVEASSHAVVREAKAAGVWVFGGGIDESVPPVTVAGDGTVADTAATGLDGGFTVLEVPDRAAALDWAAKFAVGCHCPQELRVFGFDPES
ncbi:transcription initiation protein [Agromyces archimandritae]|uniref:Transcription initiation protein n=2 Tax=Agromyces archimandritae TaxID=2781962 RepID=A0A975FPU1_9MICO|nr:transcription initiation protein [Agromyces archimandritae]